MKMKKFNCLFTAILILLSAASCGKDGFGGRISEFIPYVEDFSVKSAITSEGAYIFEQGDEMLVTNGKDQAVFSYDAESGKFRTSSPIVNNGSLQAVFPASAASVSDGRIIVNLPSRTQVYEDIVPDFPLYLWKIRDNVFKFKSFCGVAKLSLTGSGLALYDAALSKVGFVSTDNPCCGKVAVGSDGTFEFIEQEQTLEVSCEEGMDAKSDIYLILPAQKYSMGSLVRFEFTDGKKIESRTIMGIVPRSGMIKTYEIEVTADFFGPLEDYEEGESIDDKY